MKLQTSTVICLALVAGCAAPISKQAKTNMAAPVDCSTARGDIRVLNSEKANASKEIEDGFTSIFPIGLVAHLVKGDEKDDFKVGFGEYNRALDKKIAEIKEQCNIT